MFSQLRTLAGRGFDPIRDTHTHGENPEPCQKNAPLLLLAICVEEKRERDDDELLKSYFSFFLPFFGVSLMVELCFWPAKRMPG